MKKSNSSQEYKNQYLITMFLKFGRFRWCHHGTKVALPKLLIQPSTQFRLSTTRGPSNLQIFCTFWYLELIDFVRNFGAGLFLGPLLNRKYTSVKGWADIIQHFRKFIKFTSCVATTHLLLLGEKLNSKNVQKTIKLRKYPHGWWRSHDVIGTFYVA